MLSTLGGAFLAAQSGSALAARYGAAPAAQTAAGDVLPGGNRLAAWDGPLPADSARGQVPLRPAPAGPGSTPDPEAPLMGPPPDKPEIAAPRSRLPAAAKEGTVHPGRPAPIAGTDSGSGLRVDSGTVGSVEGRPDFDGESKHPAAADSANLPDADDRLKPAVGQAGRAIAPEAAPLLIILPMAGGPGADTGDVARAEAALRLGLAESERFRAPAAEPAARAWPGGHLPRGCFDARCLARAAAVSPAPLVLASELSQRGGRWVLRLALAQSPGGRLARAMQVWADTVPGGPIPFARQAGMRLADPDRDGPGSGGALFASGAWRDIPWLNPRDTVDHRARAGWTGAGLLAAGAALAYAQGAFPGFDGNPDSPARPLAPAGGELSSLRGFFSAPVLGARYAAMGGAGMAAVDDGFALLLNPAGAARAEREDVVMAKRSLPDGTPSVFAAYAGPLFRGWRQGVGIQYQGDRLAGETTFSGALACDLSTLLGREWEGVKAGLLGKLYLAQAGEGGAGLDRSTGYSWGSGWDAGIQAPLGERITAALAVRDAFGFLRHRNTFTNRSYGEILPSEWKIGAAYRAGPGLTFLLDGQKAAWADQADHLRVGGEQVLWGILALRGGLHETYGREAVRKIAVGFGLDTGGLDDSRLQDAGFKMRLALDFAYEFGMDADAPLAGGRQFSLRAVF